MASTAGGQIARDPDSGLFTGRRGRRSLDRDSAVRERLGHVTVAAALVLWAKCYSARVLRVSPAFDVTLTREEALPRLAWSAVLVRGRSTVDVRAGPGSKPGTGTSWRGRGAATTTPEPSRPRMCSVGRDGGRDRRDSCWPRRPTPSSRSISCTRRTACSVRTRWPSFSRRLTTTSIR
jgi:hypothetical protein